MAKHRRKSRILAVLKKLFTRYYKSGLNVGATDTLPAIMLGTIFAVVIFR